MDEKILRALQDIITDAHMEGQRHAGCPHASYGDASGYYFSEVEAKIKNLGESSSRLSAVRCCCGFDIDTDYLDYYNDTNGDIKEIHTVEYTCPNCRTFYRVFRKNMICKNVKQAVIELKKYIKENKNRNYT